MLVTKKMASVGVAKMEEKKVDWIDPFIHSATPEEEAEAKAKAEKAELKASADEEEAAAKNKEALAKEKKVQEGAAKDTKEVAAKAVESNVAAAKEKKECLIKATVILQEHGGMESNIGVSHEYWSLMNRYRSL